MKNKGFTIIEILAVIVILSIISIISVTAISSLKKKQDEKNEKNTISAILSGAKKYTTDHRYVLNTLPASIGINDLYEKYVDFDMNTMIDKDDVNKDTIEETIGNITVEQCSNPLKLKYSLTYKGNTYNDCGCEEQSTSPSTNQLCE